MKNTTAVWGLLNDTIVNLVTITIDDLKLKSYFYVLKMQMVVYIIFCHNLLDNYIIMFISWKYKWNVVTYFCHHLYNNYVDFSKLYVVLSHPYVDLSDRTVDLSHIYSFKNESMFPYPGCVNQFITYLFWNVNKALDMTKYL